MRGIIWSACLLLSTAAIAAHAAPQFTQIEIQAQFVAFPKTAIDALLAKAPTAIPSKDQLCELITQGKGKVLFAPRVCTQSGQEATVKAVQEIIYPTALEVHSAATNDVNTNMPAARASQALAVIPASFETREVGVIFQVLPELSDAGDIISITMAPQVCSPPEWRSYRGKTQASGQAAADVALDQPLFPISNVSTVIMVKNGDTIVAAGGMADKGNETVTFLLITAQLVDSAGRPVRTR